jgi:hypothetical protein
VIPSGGAAPLPAALPGSPPWNDEVYQIIESRESVLVAEVSARRNHTMMMMKPMVCLFARA